ncbi:MAG: T9SS type A sorting domain-containing protein [Flavobacteriia bacterium]|nr:T9SS type A sorting domain-containing protein [Flavobacteriia bacterium]
MKKIYLLATALVFGLTANAQLTDGFEEYPLGSYYGGNWKNWSMVDGPENILVVDDQASEGSQSGYIGGDEVQDAILDVGLKSSGIWTYSMDFYIDFGSSGYFNAQHDLGSLGTTGNWAYQAYIGLDPTQTGTPPAPGTFYFASAGTAYSFPYNEEEWINFAVEHHIDDDIVKLFMNGTEITFGPGVDIPFGDDPAFQGKLNGFDYYSASSINSMYIDNIRFYEGEFTMGVQDLTVSEISVYPTVAKDMVNIASKTNIDNVAVYNTSGQQVLKLNPNSANAQFNVSAMPAGVYMVKIQSGKQVMTKKIVVK